MNIEIGMKMKTQLTNLTILAALFAGTATAGNVTIPNTFTSGTKAVAAQVNDNFNAVKTAVDDNQTQIDALAPRVDGAADGDMQYWDGTAWVLLNAPTKTTATLRFCGGQPSWDCIAVGDTGPAGGIVILVNADGVTGLEAAPADLASSPLGWGCELTTTNVTDTSIGSGATNTTSLISQVCDAAVATLSYSLGGFTDWFLPSKEELNVLYNQRALLNGLDAASAYWSSSEKSNASAWNQNLNDGTPSFDGKQHPLNVRVIRAF